MNRLAVSLGRRSVLSVGKFSKPSMAACRFSTTFTDREKFEENRFIQQEEDRRKAEARARFEELLAKDSTDAQKLELLEQLVPDKKDQGFLERNGLNHPLFWIPIGLLIGTPVLANEVLVLSNETQLLGTVMLTYGLMYLKFGQSAADAFDGMIEEQKKKYHAVDDSILSGTKVNLEASKSLHGLDTTVKGMFQLVDDLHVVEAESLNSAAQQQYREAITKKLDSLVSLEEKINAQVKSRMIAQVKADVQKQFQDKKTKEQALEQALAVLSGGKGAKIGSDVVGSVFKTSIANYRSNYQKNVGDKDEILVNLEKEMQAIIQASHIAATGGNVYETNPLIK